MFLVGLPNHDYDQVAFPLWTSLSLPLENRSIGKVKAVVSQLWRDVAATTLSHSQQTLGSPRQLFEETAGSPGSWGIRARMERPVASRCLSR